MFNTPEGIIKSDILADAKMSDFISLSSNVTRDEFKIIHFLALPKMYYFKSPSGVLSDSDEPDNKHITIVIDTNKETGCLIVSDTDEPTINLF